MDYAYPSKRKTKNDRRAKGRYALYKRGGKNRATSISLRSERESKDQSPH